MAWKPFFETFGHQPQRQSYVAESQWHAQRRHEAIGKEPSQWDRGEVKHDRYQPKYSQRARHQGEAVQQAVEDEDPSINSGAAEAAPPYVKVQPRP